MKLLFLILAILFIPSLASAQCNGVFPPGTYCGNNSLVPSVPSPVPQVNTFPTVAADTVLCNPTGSPAIVQACTVAQTKSLLTVEVSVTDPAFGAKCDGTTDDTTAIQNAINSLPASGGIVLFPVATCRISTTLTIGNGTTSAFSTQSGVFLKGRGIPNSINFFGAYPATVGPKLQWIGASTVPMISVAGPLQGWGIHNLYLDCGSVATIGLRVTSASYGDVKNLSVVDCTTDGILSTSNPLGPYVGTTHVDSLRNQYSNISILVPTTFQAHALVFAGAADGTSSTDYNVVSNLIIGFRSNNSQAGIYLGIADSNIFQQVSIAGMSATHSGIQLDYSTNNTFPLSNIFYGLEVQGGTPYATIGSPGAGSKSNYVIGPLEANGGVAPNNIAGWQSATFSNSGNLAGWITYTPSASCGSATFTVNSARYTTVNKATTAQLDITISTIGSCTNVITFNLPATSFSGGGFAGREMAVSFLPIACSILDGGQTTASCVKPALQNFAANERIIVSGTYESQ